MHLVRRSCALLSATVLTTTLLAVDPSAATAPASAPTATDRGSAQAQALRGSKAQVLFNWELIAFRTVYTVGATPIPTGIPVLGFNSLAMHRAVQSSLRQDVSSERAAIVAAAYRVLRHYFPAQGAQLSADQAASLAILAPGRAKRVGVKVGKRAARHLLRERVGDRYMDATIHYALPPGPGVWQPAAPNTDMLGAWVGSLRHLVVKKHVKVGGPDALTSSAYTGQFEEVKSLGSNTSTARTEAQRQTTLFFNVNIPIMYGDALIRYLQAHPMRLADAARLFAAMHAAMTDGVIQCWRLKRDVGFWRPIEAIRAADDGNPATTQDATWTPLLTTPNYSDYVSGHGCVTGSAMEVIRRTLGERTPLELISPASPIHRTYPKLRDLEEEAFGTRIWGGLHFRTAMDDAYRIGHITARRVLKALD